MQTYSMTNRCLVNTLDLLQVLNACCAASIACVNSVLVVSGTRVSNVCDAWKDSQMIITLSNVYT